jgi:hypothetical protein
MGGTGSRQSNPVAEGPDLRVERFRLVILANPREGGDLVPLAVSLAD